MPPGDRRIVPLPADTQPRLIVYVDAEEEFDWTKPFSSTETSVTNLQHQQPLLDLLGRHGIVPTFLVDFPAVDTVAAVECLGRFLEQRQIAIGAQLHPWVTPPLEEQVTVPNSFPGNLPATLERRKIQTLTNRIVECFGKQPIIYRAGRYGLGPNTAETLRDLGYRMDCSVFPGRSFRTEGGTSFLDSPTEPFWIADGVLEIPLTGGYIGRLRGRGPSLSRFLEQKYVRGMRLHPVLRRVGLFDCCWLSPEGVPLEEAKALTRLLHQDGVRVFSVTFHSPSMVPGHTPYVRTREDRDQLLGWLDSYCTFFRRELGGFGTLPDEVYTLAKRERARLEVGPKPSAARPARPSISVRGAKARDILLFDFISHGQMHHAFNEGYVRTLAEAFPDDRIRFHSRAENAQAIAPLLADLDRVEVHEVDGYVAPGPTSPFDVRAEERSAAPCLAQVTSRLGGGSDARLVALLGTTAGLYAAFRKHWGKSVPVPLHIVMHGQLGQTYLWRTRNPILRRFDLRGQMDRALPSNVKIVTLELGIREAMTRTFKIPGSSIAVLEHPVLPGEWADPLPDVGAPPLRIGFLGSIREGKGFETFVDIASRVRRPELTFHAVGHLSRQSAVDQSGLAEPASTVPLSREKYLARLRRLNFVCLTLQNRAYDFTASGTLCDAIAALKPILAIRNMTLEAIFEKYGPVGRLFANEGDLMRYLQSVRFEEMLQDSRAWQRNLMALRAARHPAALAPIYGRIVLAETTLQT